MFVSVKYTNDDIVFLAEIPFPLLTVKCCLHYRDRGRAFMGYRYVGRAQSVPTPYLAEVDRLCLRAFANDKNAIVRFAFQGSPF